jgi:hypothetical protein
MNLWVYLACRRVYDDRIWNDFGSPPFNACLPTLWGFSIEIEIVCWSIKEAGHLDENNSRYGDRIQDDCMNNSALEAHKFFLCFTLLGWRFRQQWLHEEQALESYLTPDK